MNIILQRLLFFGKSFKSVNLLLCHIVDAETLRMILTSTITQLEMKTSTMLPVLALSVCK
jgi:hypothetical protein